MHVQVWVCGGPGLEPCVLPQERYHTFEALLAWEARLTDQGGPRICSSVSL